MIDVVRLFIATLSCLALSIPLQAQLPISWSQNIGNAQKNIIVDIVDIPGEGSLSLGYSKPDADSDFELWINRIDIQGALIWSKTYGSTGFEKANAAALLSNGNFVIVGQGAHTDGDFAGASKRADGIILQIDSDGDVIWTRTYGGLGHDQFSDVIALPSGECLAVGATSSYINNFDDRATDGWAVKINNNGGVIWNRRFGGSLMDSYQRGILNADGSFILGGTSDSRDGQSADSFGADDLWLSKLNADGTHAWSRNYGGDARDVLHAMTATVDGGYVLGATTYSAHAGSKGHGDIWVLKVSALGNQLWERIIGGTATEKCADIQPFEEDGFLLVANTMSTDGDINSPLGGQDAWIAKLSATGNIEWKDNLGGTQNDALLAAHTLADGSVWLAGYSFSSDKDLSANSGMQDGWVIRSNAAEPPTVSLGGNVDICIGTELMLDATDPNCLNCAYLWSDSFAQAIRTILVSSSATYAVTLTNSSGVTTSDAVTITAVNPISATSTIDQVDCADAATGAIVLDVVGGTGEYDFSWSNANMDATNTDIIPGTYFVTISDDALCEFTDSYVLDNPAPIVVEVTLELPSCTSTNQGAISLAVTGGEAPYQYRWDNGLIGPIITGLDPGQYTVTIIDARNCNHVETIELSNDLSIDVATVIMNVSCYEESDGEISLAVTGDFPPFAFDWDIGISSNSIIGLSAGDFTVTITDAMGCQLVRKYTITQPDPLAAIVDQTNTVQGEATGSILLNISGGIPSYTVDWNNGEQGNLLDNLSAGVYEATIVDANDCVLEVSYEVSILTATSDQQRLPLTVYPNPSLGLIYIQIPDASSHDFDITLYDVRGSAIAFHTGPSVSGQLFLEVDQYVPGLYLLSMTSANQTYQAKVIFQ